MTTTNALRIFLLLILVMLTACASPAKADHGWSPLGQRTVNDRAEFDAIRVGPDRGRFSAIRLSVDDAPVLFRRIEVEFGNGESVVLRPDRVVGEYHRTRALQLPGGPRYIRRVVFFYEAASPGWEKATVSVWGQR